MEAFISNEKFKTKHPPIQSSSSSLKSNSLKKIKITKQTSETELFKQNANNNSNAIKINDSNGKEKSSVPHKLDQLEGLQKNLEGLNVLNRSRRPCYKAAHLKAPFLTSSSNKKSFNSQKVNNKKTVVNTSILNHHDTASNNNRKKQ